jgi:hypothetical protein
MNKVIATLLVLLLVPMAALAQNELIVTELMYNSPGDDVEWIEMVNNTEMDLDLTGWYVVDDNSDHTPMPLSGILGAGEVLVLVGDIDLFSAQYPTVTNYVEGVYFQSYGDTWALGNGGDGVQIFNAAAELVFAMNYDDGGDWPSECDGDGPSLQLVTMACSDFNDPACWMAGPDWGTPGIIEGTVATVSTSLDGIKALFR